MAIFIGQKFGEWTVLSNAGKNNDRRQLWLCKCSCGRDKKVTERYLLAGTSTNCGCRKGIIDIAGKIFGKLTVIRYMTEQNPGHRKWLCQCECGNTFEARGDWLIDGVSTHCGCSRKVWHKNICESKYSKEEKSIISVYYDVLRRCYNPNRKEYVNYGARGIIVCEEWLNNKLAFLDWSKKNGWNDALEIDRIDVNGNYEPSNCRFVTSTENARNKRNTKLSYSIVENIKELRKGGMRLKDISKMYNVKESCISRVCNGKRWKNDKTSLTTP